MNADLYTRVTDQIIASLERGVRPWQCPWSTGTAEPQGMRPLRGNGVPYRGINVLILWGAALDCGFTGSTWLTFKQALEVGGCVRKGEKGSLVVYAGSLTRTGTDEATDDDSEQRIPFLKGYTVFNVDQIDGLPDSYRTPAPALPDRLARIECVVAFTAATGAIIRHGGNKAFYSPSGDFVQMPPLQAFRDAEAYYGTLTHELTHWTGHKSRLDRTFGKRFADKAYAFEELVAELGAAFVSASLNLTPEPRPDHADYIGHWLDVMKTDKRAIFTAASHAQRAADFLTAEPVSEQVGPYASLHIAA